MAKKRIFYLTNHQLSVYLWQAGCIEHGPTFAAGEQGVAEFVDYLKTDSTTVSYFLVDIIEEEFHRDTIPHLMGRDRQAILQRKRSQLFRHTPFHITVLQGRENSGRRDDKVLFAGLTNPDVLTMWLSRFEEHKVPLAGIFSMSMLTHRLMKKLGVKSPNALLIAQHGDNGLRQTFLNGVDVKISRFSPLSINSDNQYGAQVLNEVYKNQRYLVRLRLLQTNDAMDVFVLTQGERLNQLQTACIDTKNLRYHFIQEQDIARDLGLKQSIPVGHSELLFIHFLAQTRPTINYARSKEKRYYTMELLRKTAMAAGAAFALTSVAWSAANWTEAGQYRDKIDNANREAVAFQAQYEQALAALPATPAQAREMQRAVDIAARIVEQKTNPQLIMIAISKALDSYADISVNDIEWQATDNPDSVFAANRQSGQTSMNRTSEYALPPMYQVVVLHARLQPFEGDFRYAFNRVEDFVNALRANDKITDVQKLKMPLDVDPRSTLVGTAGVMQEIPTAYFELKIVYKVRDASV